MAEIEYDEWMSDSDAVIWNIERDPLLRSTVTSLWFLESMPDREQVDAVVQGMVEHLPRLTQRVVDDPNGIATPRWEADPNFELSYHYRWSQLAGEHPTRSDVLAHAEQVAGRAFDRDRALWEVRILEGLPDNRGAFIMTLHHAIADGLGMVNMLQHMVRLGPIEPAAEQPDSPGRRPDVTPHAHPSIDAAGRSIVRRLQTDARTSLRVGEATFRAANDLFRHPFKTAQSAMATAASVASVLKPAPTPLSTLMIGRSLARDFDTLTVDLVHLKAAAKTADGTINDGFVAAILDGLDRYHQHYGKTCAEIRMGMPVSIRSEDTSAQSSNQFVPTRVILPLAAESMAERLAATRTHLREVRAEPALPHLGDISGAIGRFGPDASVALIGGMMKGVDITTSNVPGPPFPVWMANSRVNEFYAFGPLAGSAINVTLFSYDGLLHLGINSDSSAVPEPAVLVRSFQDAFDSLLALAPY